MHHCEQADILAAICMAKANQDVLMFESPTLPRVVKDYLATVRVTPYGPKRMIRFGCHSIGHLAKYCPRQPVCRNPHNKEENCELSSVACKEDGRRPDVCYQKSKCPLSAVIAGFLGRTEHVDTRYLLQTAR